MRRSLPAPAASRRVRGVLPPGDREPAHVGAASPSARSAQWLSKEGAESARRVSSQPDVGAREDLWKALATLPARQRAALVLRYYEDLSERETAEVLGCSVAAVKSLVARGGGALRELIRGEDA